MATTREEFLKEIRTRIDGRLDQINTETEGLRERLTELTEEVKTLENWLGDMPSVTKAPPAPKPEAKKPPKKPKKKRPSGRPVRVSKETEDAVWLKLRDMAPVSAPELAAAGIPGGRKGSLTVSAVQFALNQMIANERATRTQEERLNARGRKHLIWVYRIVSPQKEGTDAPTTRPRQPTPEQVAVAEARKRGTQPTAPSRGRPVPGTGRRAVTLPSHGDTAKLVLQAVKQGWYTVPDGRDHIRVISPDGKREVRVYKTPSAPSLDKIKKEFREKGVTFNA
jgi:hypothetical protein